MMNSAGSKSNKTSGTSKGSKERQYQRVGIHEEDQDLDLEDEEVHHDLTLQAPSARHGRTFEQDDDPLQEEEEHDEPPPNPFLDDSPILHNAAGSSGDKNNSYKMNDDLLHNDEDDYEIDSEDEMELERYAFDFSSQQQKRRRQRLHTSSSTNTADAERGRAYSSHSTSDLLQSQSQQQPHDTVRTDNDDKDDKSFFGIRILVHTLVEKVRSARLESRRKRAERLLEEDTIVPPFNRRFSRYFCGCCGWDRYCYYYWQKVSGSSWCDLLDGRGVVLLLVVCLIWMGLVQWLDPHHWRLWLGVGIGPFLLLRVCAWRLVYWILWGRWIEKRRQETMDLYDGLNGEHGTGGIQITFPPLPNHNTPPHYHHHHHHPLDKDSPQPFETFRDEEQDLDSRMEPIALSFERQVEDNLDDGTENANDELSYTSHTSTIDDPPRPHHPYDTTTTTPTKPHDDPNMTTMELV